MNALHNNFWEAAFQHLTTLEHMLTKMCSNVFNVLECLKASLEKREDHYSDVKMGAMASQKSPAWRLFTQPFVRVQIKENSKFPRHWHLCGEFTGDQWILRTKGQLRGKCFHLMTSSCYRSISRQTYSFSAWLYTLLTTGVRNTLFWGHKFSAANLALAGVPLTNPLGENLSSCH